MASLMQDLITILEEENSEYEILLEYIPPSFFGKRKARFYQRITLHLQRGKLRQGQYKNSCL